MDQWHMVALEVILDIGLPVTPDCVRTPQRKRLNRFIRPRRIHRRHHLGDRRRCFAERDKQESPPGLHPHRRQPLLTRIKPVRRAEIPSRLQPTFEREPPAMIGAGDSPLAMPGRRRCERPCPVRAHVVERAHHAVLAAYGENGSPGDLIRQEVACRLQHVLMPDQPPCLGEYGLPFQRKHFRSPVERWLQRPHQRLARPVRHQGTTPSTTISREKVLSVRR